MNQAIHNLRRIARLASKTKGMVKTAADLMAVDNILYLATDVADRLGTMACSPARSANSHLRTPKPHHD